MKPLFATSEKASSGTGISFSQRPYSFLVGEALSSES
jgi:hypothetical protein